MDSMMITIAEIVELYGGEKAKNFRGTVRKACAAAELDEGRKLRKEDVRRSGGIWLIDSAAAEKAWGKRVRK
jgi:hypothetical protein